MKSVVNCVTVDDGAPFAVTDGAGGLHRPVEVAFAGATTSNVANLIDRLIDLVEQQSPEVSTTNFISRMPAAGGMASGHPYDFEAYDPGKVGGLRVIKGDPNEASNFMVRGSIFRWNSAVSAVKPVVRDSERFAQPGDDAPADIPAGATFELPPPRPLEATGPTGATGPSCPVGATVTPPDVTSTSDTDATNVAVDESLVVKGSTALQNPLDVRGYTPQAQSKIDAVNENKILEERVLRRLDELAHWGSQLTRIPSDDEDKSQCQLYDPRMLVLARTGIQEAFMWMNRAIFKPTRVSLPEDNPAGATGS